MRRLFAIDPSLTCTGWALFAFPPEGALGGLSSQEGHLLAVGKVRAKKPQFSMAERLRDLHDKVSRLVAQLELSQNDVLLCEAPTTMRDPRAALVVEQVRGIFESVGRERGLRVPGRVNPRSVQFEVMGLRGRQPNREAVKQVARDIAMHLYGEKLSSLGLPLHASQSQHQDIVDAVLIGAYGISKIAHAEQVGEPWEQFFSQNEPASRKRFGAAFVKRVQQ
ncbi:hypothetical protein MRY87_04970 [bacterium]|nr:hypothetical protein [bacterium]